MQSCCVIRIWNILLLMMLTFVPVHALGMKNCVILFEGESLPDTVQMSAEHDTLFIEVQDIDAPSVRVLDISNPSNDSMAIADSVSVHPEHEKVVEAILQNIDTTAMRFSITADSLLQLAAPQEKGRFIPNPKKAMWLAMIIPGGGQIYNRKYWKLPLVYGGFIGCVYAMTWNNTMYRTLWTATKTPRAMKISFQTITTSQPIWIGSRTFSNARKTTIADTVTLVCSV